MDNNIQNELKSILNDEIQSYRSSSDLKTSIGHLKVATAVNKILSDDEEKELNEKNRQERLSLEKEKAALDKRKFNFERKKTDFDQKIELKKIELETAKLEFETKKLEANKSQNKTDIIIKICLATAALVPPVLGFIGGMMALKLEYRDMGRTPSSFKEFMRSVKN